MSRRTVVVTWGVGGALVLMMLSATGGAIAAVKIGSSQIADNSIRSRDVRDGSLKLRDLDPSTRSALSETTGPQGPGPQGPAGADGPAGVAGDEGAPGTDGVVQVAALVGPVASILGNSGAYVFAGPAAQISTTASHPRVTASAAAPMGLKAGSTPQTTDVGMCYQPSAGGVLTNFYTSNYSIHYFTTERATYTAAATMLLPPGTFNVGMCVRNTGGSTINNNNYVNGWVMVTS